MTLLISKNINTLQAAVCLEFLDAFDAITCYIKGDHQEIDGKVDEIRKYLERI
jgi:hypothetical protein